MVLPFDEPSSRRVQEIYERWCKEKKRNGMKKEDEDIYSTKAWEELVVALQGEADEEA